MPEDYLTTEAAAALTGYHPEHIRRLIRQGKVSAKKWGTQLMVSRRSLLKYLKAAENLGDKPGPKPKNS